MPPPPGNPSAYDKVNYVIDAWARPCEAPWYIYIETLKPALLEAFITLATFGWDDVARGYLRPRGLGGRRTGKRKGKWRRALPRFPELGEEIGKRLPGAEQVKGERWSCLGKTLWRIDTIIQRGLFWWLVADVTVDLAFNWTSVLYETVWCQASDLGRFSYTNTENHGSGPDSWNVIHYGTRDYQFAPPFWLHTRGGSGVNRALFAACVTLTPLPGEDPPTEVSLRIIEHGTGRVLAQEGPHPPDFPDDIKSCVSVELAPFILINVQVKHNGGNCDMSGGFVTGMEI